MTATLHPTAVVGAEAHVGDNVIVGPYAVIESGAIVGARCEVRAHAVVKASCVLGTDNVVHEGAILGGEPQDLSFSGGKTGVVIGDRNQIREGVTVHRATREGSATVVGSDCYLMAYAHVAHDNRIGNQVILANNVALAGHVEIADRAVVGGCAGIHQFCRVGRLAMVGGHSKIVQDCLPFFVTDGTPGRARGLNLVGLRRAGVGTPGIRALKEAYRLLFRATLRLETALERMAAIQDPLVDELAAFTRGSSRGFAHAGSSDPE
jgi:UDP-N-acetylglucosamine acyltransferase